MQLKKLQLVGFKTFADKTEIEIGQGLTAVVGPNGSGKSNVGDALLWVMGEQNPRLLRGNDARDVIFNGTDKRKAMGMAEVRLTIDNSDKSLPVDFAEVTITRRVYRSGESQYLINNAPCRLKDIVELFLDTGIGKGAYGFVSQSEIDAVLSARPEDRRELFEEAAGIKKYRVKKREAVRKLEQAEANLNRVRDIVYELETQREPLREQAEQARRYLQLTERLQQIEVDLLIAEVKRADYELYAARQERDLDSEAIQTLDANLAVLERDAEALGERLARAEQEADVARISHQGALSGVERTESQLLLVQERGRSAEQTADSLDGELRELEARMASLRRDVQQQEAAITGLTGYSRERAEELAAARTRVKELESAHAEAVRLSEDRQGALLKLAEQRAQREAALEASRVRFAESEARLATLEREIASAHAQLAEAERRRDQALEREAALRLQSEELAARRAELEERRRKLKDLEAQARTSLDAQRRLQAERSSRLTTLTELQESGEGFYQGVRAVLKATRDLKLQGFYAPAVDLLTVPEQYRVAIEVALGGSLQDIVCETEEEAKRAIEWLKAQRAGRATFLALPLLRPAPPLQPSALRGYTGLLGVASHLVSAEPRFDVVLQLLLGRVVLAQEMDAAVHAARRLQGWSRIVTLEGELVTPGGALTGGSLQGRGGHLVGRKGEIDDLKRALPGLRAEIQRLEEEQQHTVATLAEVEARLSELARESAAVQAQAASTTSEASAAERDVARLKSDLSDLSDECERLVQSREALTAEIARWTAALQESASEDTGADDAIAAAQEEAARLTQLLQEARTQATALEVESGRATEKRAALERSLHTARHALKESEAAHAAKQSQRELAGARFAESGAQEVELSYALEAARARLAECEEQLHALQEQCKVLRGQSFEQTTAIKEAIHDRGRIQGRLHDAELQIARLEVRLAQASQRLLDEYAISLEEALGRPDGDEVEKSTVQEVGRMRRDIRAMGTVNTGAVEEYERLTERYDFLSGQRADLEKAREGLLATIAEIDESTRGIFMETFEAVSEEFGKLFNRLFNGGTTKLILTDPDNVLETGIDVIAQPPGKKPQHLSLLSGGERALTAVALLFSFLAVRPSPFCLLDEVDAPLDGANVEKFVELVRDFSQDTQFLVITHNPTTMEASPRWYGVTMQEAGISRILSYRVPQEAVVSEPEDPLRPLEPLAVVSRS